MSRRPPTKNEINQKSQPFQKYNTKESNKSTQPFKSQSEVSNDKANIPDKTTDQNMTEHKAEEIHTTSQIHSIYIT